MFRHDFWVQLTSEALQCVIADGEGFFLRTQIAAEFCRFFTCFLNCRTMPFHQNAQRVIIRSHPDESYPMQWLSHDWSGAAVEPPVEFALFIEEQCLVLRVRRETSCCLNPATRCGQCVQGLWLYDTAELFVRGATNDSPYLELNLAPNGAWWACAFTAPRAPHTQFHAAALGVQTAAECTAARWQAELRLPIAALHEYGWRHMADLHMSVCAILRTPDATRRFMSTCMVGEKPEFHCPHDWPAAEVAQV